jgi:hypothetical protein
MKNRNICIALVMCGIFLLSFATAMAFNDGELEVEAPYSVDCGEKFEVFVKWHDYPVPDAIVQMIDPDLRRNKIIEEDRTDSNGAVYFSAPPVRMEVKIIATKGEMSGETVIEVR